MSGVGNTNWGPSRVGANGTNNWLTTDVVVFGAAGTANSRGINFGTGANGGGSSLSIAAIELSSSNTVSKTIGSSSTNGTLTLNGGTVNSIGDVILRNNSGVGLVLRDNETGTGKVMNVALGNTTENKIYVDGAGSITISSAIQGTSKVLSLYGAGSGKLILNGTNTWTGGFVLNSGQLQLETNASGTFTALSSGTLTINGGTVGTGGSSQIATNKIVVSNNFAVGTGSGSTFSGNVDLTGSNRTITLSNSTAFNGVISNGSLTVASTSVGRSLILSNAANTFTNDILVNGGALEVVKLANIGGSSSIGTNGAILLGGTNNTASILRYIGSGDTFDRTIVLATTNTTAGGLDSSGSGALVFSGVLSNSGTSGSKNWRLGGTNTNANDFQSVIADGTNGGTINLVKNDSGTWTVSATTNSYSGDTTINDGTLSVSSLKNAGSVSSLGTNGAIKFGTTNTTGTLNYTGAGDTNNRDIRVGDTNVASTATGGAIIQNNGSGALVFTKAAFNNTASGVTAARTLTLGGANASNNEIQGSIIDNNTAGGGTIGLTKTNVGKWVLSGSNSYTGTTVAGGGELVLNNSNAVSGSTVSYSNQGGTLTLATNIDQFNFGGLSGAQNLGLTNATNGAITLRVGGNNSNTTYSGALSGAGAFTKVGTATLTLGGSNTFTGTTTISDGRINTTTNTFINSTNIVINGGTLNFSFGGGIQTINPSSVVTMSSGQWITADRNQTVASIDMSGGTLDRSGFGNLTFTNLSSVTGGTVRLTGTNSDVRFTGGLVLGGATFVYTNAANHSNTPVRIYPSLTYSSTNTTAAWFTNAAVGIGRLQIGANATDTNTFDIGDSASLDSEVNIDWLVQTGVLLKKGDGVLALLQSNSYSNTIINAGTIRAGNNGAIGIGSLTLSNGTIASSTNVARTFTNAVTLAGNATFGDAIGTGVLTFSNAGTGLGGGTNVLTAAVATTFNGVLSNGGFIKAGAATLTLAGTTANSYAGATTVSNGTLNLNKTAGVNAISGSSVTIATNATLLLSASNQVIDTATITLSGGTIARASGETETFGNLDLTASSFLNYGSGTTNSLNFGTYTGGGFKLTVNNFLAGNVLTFKTDLSGSISNSSFFAFSDAFTSDWNVTTANTFTITAIPEPSTILAAIGLAGAMLWPARRRIGAMLRRG